MYFLKRVTRLHYILIIFKIIDLLKLFLNTHPRILGIYIHFKIPQQVDVITLLYLLLDIILFWNKNTFAVYFLL